MIRARVMISGDPISQAHGAETLRLILEAELARYGLEDEVQVGFIGQIGRRDVLPFAVVYPEGTLYGPLRPEDVPFLVEEHLYKGRIAESLLAPPDVLSGAIARLPRREGVLYGQQRVVLARAGIIDPNSIEEYIAHDGYFALARAVTEMTPEQVLRAVKDSGLQGRGGAGFPTGTKWQFVASQPAPQRYIVCNADESEPGTFKDRLILEGDPHAVLEGMALAGYAVGAHEGWIYIRGEYGLAKQRVEKAVEQAEEMGLLGDKLFDSGFSFHIHVHAGAGAYVCGEETALLESLEGKRGIPRIRPPYPTVRGYHGMPTVVNNVETLANVPAIIHRGVEWYRTLGTPKSPGTKVYTMLGDVNITGLIEVPMGITLREVVEVYGGGMRDGLTFKCAQTGGAAGSIIAPDLLDVPMDYATMQQHGALLVCGNDKCIVDLAYVLMRFFASESCGKCVPCRLGTRRMLEILGRLRDGQGTAEDLDALATIAPQVIATSFCGLGQGAPVSIITALRHFRSEFEAHVAGTCPAGVCPMGGPEPAAEPSHAYLAFAD